MENITNLDVLDTDDNWRELATILKNIVNLNPIDENPGRGFSKRPQYKTQPENRTRSRERHLQNYLEEIEKKQEHLELKQYPEYIMRRPDGTIVPLPDNPDEETENEFEEESEDEDTDIPLIRRFKSIPYNRTPSQSPTPSNNTVNSEEPDIDSPQDQEQQELQQQQNQEQEIVGRIRTAQRQDPELVEIIEDTTHNPDSDYSIDQRILLFKGNIVVPNNNEIKKDILSLCHDQPLAGHFGTFKTYNLVKRTFYWKGMKKYIQKYVTSCDTCQRNKTARHKPFGLLQPLPIPEHPWSSISMDFITHLPKSKDYDTILVVVDRLTKMAHFIPTKNNNNAEEIVQLLIENIISKHGIPDDIISDRDTLFTAHFTKAMLKGLGITQKLSTAFHPQTDGQTERTNGTLEQYLRCFVNYQQDNWTQLLPLAELSYNNTIHTAINETPFYATFGYHANINIPRTNSNVPRAEARLEQLHEVQEEIQLSMSIAQESYALYYDRHATQQPDFNIGDKVRLNKKYIKTQRPSEKLDHQRLGPFEIVEKIGTRAYKLDLPAGMNKIHPVFHVSLLSKDIPNEIEGRIPPPPPPIIVENQEEYEVEDVVDSRIKYNQLQYLVHWKGYSIADRSWIPAQDINSRRTLAHFHTKYPNKPGTKEFKLCYPNTLLLYHEEDGTSL